MIEAIKLFLIGIVLGAANVIPGVSGGTIAVVFNIYDRLINSVTYNIKKLWKNRAFLIPLILGAAVGLVALSKVIVLLYSRFPVQTNSFFTGLILGSIPLLISFIIPKNKAKISPVKTLALILPFAAGLILILIFSRLSGTASDSAALTALPSMTLPLVIKLFFGGFLGAVAMVIPGISGSLLMLIIGVYPIIIAAIPCFFHAATMLPAFLILFPAGLGVLAGLLAGAKTIGLLLKKFPSATYAVILGLIVGSALTIFPWKEILGSAVLCVTSIVALVAGFLLAYLSTKFSRDEKSRGNA